MVASLSDAEDCLMCPLVPGNITKDRKKETMAVNRRESQLTFYLLAALSVFTGVSFTRMFSFIMEEEPPPSLSGRQTFVPPGNSPLGAQHTLGQTALMDDPNAAAIELPHDLGKRMREWLAKTQLKQSYFYNPPEDQKPKKPKVKPYSAKQIAATIPHFTRELLLVMYTAETDEFIVLLPGGIDSPEPPRCDGGCVRIENIMRVVLFAFRNRFPGRFQRGGEDFLFLVSTGDTPRLSRECLERPGKCNRRKAFAPILHFGSGFREGGILPSLVLMPPPPGVHLRCMAEWQRQHEVCEFLLPKRVTEDGRETPGITFGEHVNYNLRTGEEDAVDGIDWKDLIPQVVWRGSDFPYLALLHPEMGPPEFPKVDVPDPNNKRMVTRTTLEALDDAYDTLLPRWKAVHTTAHAEWDADTRNANPKRKQRVIPWANMKFSTYTPAHERWHTLGIPATGEEMSNEALAKFKYHIDIGGGGGTSLQENNNPGTLEKLALPGLLFHHESAGVDWYHEHLVPGVHYIPVKEDLSDLKEQFEWAEKHDKKARQIAKAGTEFVRRMGRPEGIDELYRRHLLKPLEELIQAYEPMEEMLPELFGGDGGFIFEEVMRCTGHEVDECVLLHHSQDESGN